MDERRDDRSLGQLFADLTKQLNTLVRQEFELARTEITSKAGAAGRDAGMVGAGGVAIHAAFLGVMAAVALGLVEAGLAPWLAALVVALAVGAVGAVLVQRGRSGLVSRDLVPKQTAQTIKDDAEWAKERLR